MSHRVRLPARAHKRERCHNDPKRDHQHEPPLVAQRTSSPTSSSPWVRLIVIWRAEWRSRRIGDVLTVHAIVERRKLDVEPVVLERPIFSSFSGLLACGRLADHDRDRRASVEDRSAQRILGADETCEIPICCLAAPHRGDEPDGAQQIGRDIRLTADEIRDLNSGPCNLRRARATLIAGLIVERRALLHAHLANDISLFDMRLGGTEPEAFTPSLTNLLTGVLIARFLYKARETFINRGGELR